MKIDNTIYLDHQATTPLDSRVLSGMLPYFGREFGNPHSVDHIFGWKAAQALEKAKIHVARLIGADSDEIIFTSGATEANNLALFGVARHSSNRRRRRILISPIEHKCILSICKVLHERLGFKIEKLPVDSNGFINMNALRSTLDNDVLAVSIMAVNNEIGTIQDIEELSKLIRSNGAIFHCDAAQAPGAINLGSAAEWVDLLSLSAHKMYGPQGIGALFISRSLHSHIEPLIYGGGQQQNLRSGSVPLALCVGMGVAANLINETETQLQIACLRKRRDRFVQMLLELQYPISLNGPNGDYRHPANANISFEGFNAHEILHTLQPNLAASTGAACASGIPEPSHVLRAIGLSNERAESSIRFSLGRSTTDTDLDSAVNLIKNSLLSLSRVSICR